MEAFLGNDVDGESPMFLAIKNGQLRTVQALVTLGGPQALTELTTDPVGSIKRCATRLHSPW